MLSPTLVTLHGNHASRIHSIAVKLAKGIDGRTDPSKGEGVTPVAGSCNSRFRFLFVRSRFFRLLFLPFSVTLDRNGHIIESTPQ